MAKLIDTEPDQEPRPSRALPFPPPAEVEETGMPGSHREMREVHFRLARAVLVGAAVALSWGGAVRSQGDPACVVYMEADAAFFESREWREMADLVNDPEIAPVVDVIGVPAGRKGFNEAVDGRRRAYLGAYDGSASDHGGVMSEILMRERRGCRRRGFPMDGPDASLKPVPEWTSRDRRAVARFMRARAGQ